MYDEFSGRLVVRIGLNRSWNVQVYDPFSLASRKDWINWKPTDLWTSEDDKKIEWFLRVFWSFFSKSRLSVFLLKF